MSNRPTPTTLSRSREDIEARLAAAISRALEGHLNRPITEMNVAEIAADVRLGVMRALIRSGVPV